ncbi:MAG: GNAT family N-acetyltransferase [Mycobacteriales bacterium]
MDVRHLGDAEQALAEVSESLRDAGAEGELSFGILRRLIGEPDAYGDEVTILIGTRSGKPAALVTMTGPHPALIVGFADVAEVGFADLVGGMLDTGRRPLGVNGARRWSEPFVGAWHDLAGATPAVYRDMHAFELRMVRPPRSPAGRFRLAAAGEADALAGWFVGFGTDIRERVTADEAARRVALLISGGDLAVWELDGEAVSMAAVSRRTPWSSSIGFVYTPPGLRGRGYASAVTAALSQRELDAGQGWCSLFTDQANATSNHIYADIGYEPKSEFRHFTLTW